MAETEVKDPETTPKVDEVKTKHEPQEGSKRWDEIYAKQKQGDRDNVELQKKLDEQGIQVAAMQQHNVTLQEAVESLNSKVSDTGRPDPTLDPEAYADWREERFMDKLLKKTNPEPKSDTTTTPKPESKVPTTLATQIIVQRGLHTDYVEVVKEAEEVMAKNAYLNAEIRGDEDPAKAAYDYGIKQRETAKVESEQNRGQGHVEGGSYPVGKSGNSLTSAQIEVARKLDVTPEAYAKQLDIMSKGRR